MYPVIPTEMICSGMQLLIYATTALAALISFLMTARA